MIKKILNNFRPFLKYCIVGTIGTFLDIAGLYILVEYFGVDVILATTLSFILAVSNNFIFNKIWTFRSPSKNYRKLYIKFLIISSIGLGLTLICMHIFVNFLDIWYIFAKMLTSLIVLSWNFVGNKFWTFRFYKKILTIPKKFDFKFTIIIPTYNEEKRIRETLITMNHYIKSNNVSAEIIVVNDGSTDKTADVVRKFQKNMPNLKLLEYEKNTGKGFAVKTGVRQSHGEYIVFADADNSTPIEELDHLYQKLKENNAEIAIGSRYLPASKIKRKQPRYRVILGRLGNILIRTFLLKNIKDTQCGFKLFTHRAAKEIFYLQRVRRFGFDMEALVIAKSFGYKIVEVPVSWFNSAESRVRPVKDALRTLIDLAYIKLNLWSGRYSTE